jgi:hypothetical protein
MSYKSTPVEIEATSGGATAAKLVADTRFVRKAIVTHKGTGSNLKLGVDVLGSVIFPGQSYTLEPSANFKFDLSLIKSQDVGEATEHAVHVLAWV